MMDGLQPISGTLFAFQALGEGRDVVDGHHSVNWTAVLKKNGGTEYEVLRKFPSYEDAFSYLQVQLNAARRNMEERN